MPKRKYSGAHRRVRSRAARQIRRDSMASFERRELAQAETAAKEKVGQWAADPYAPQFGDTVVLSVPMDCASCPTEIAVGAEATYIDDALNCTECTWEARHPHG